MATGGYVVTAVATGALGAATSVWQVGIARATAWTARGVRTPARDALLASLAQPGAYGRAYGLERAGDNLGAVVGPLLAAGLISWIGVRNALYLSAIPGLFAAAAIGVAAAEARRRVAPTLARGRMQLRALRGHGLARPMVPIAMFELANMATALLILRATDLLQADGRSTTDAAALAILIYTAHNLIASLVAYLGGHWIDRAGSTRAFATGALLHAVAYAAFALPLEAWPLLLGAFVIAGAGVGVAETAESTVVARAHLPHLVGRRRPRGSRRAPVRDHGRGDHMPGRARAGDADRGHGRHRARGPPRNPVQERDRHRAVRLPRLGRARQDRHPDPRRAGSRRGCR
jgi:MFS family permease